MGRKIARGRKARTIIAGSPLLPTVKIPKLWENGEPGARGPPLVGAYNV